MQNQPRIVSIYIEDTPNPETKKFVLNHMLLPQNSADFPTAASAEGIAPLATALFEYFETVKGVFIMNNFVTITKTTDADWLDISSELREFLRGYVMAGQPIVYTIKLAEQMDTQASTTNTNVVTDDDDDTVRKIKDILTKYVQPAVAMDGGSIVFRSYADGILRLGMQGSCSGCPSSSVTLKAGIEGLLKRMVPEVQEVEAEML
ncbi:MAG: NifU family protein [Sphingobacteriales bacterium]|jgi:Fe-S cluster biogenesis protein NfuA|nr:NifU family protein [Sphingobacteriales bacterium]MBP9142125.1 NifU family protein [Chitinophagales bacterium]MDA0198637.1 NifU family protein [Bacteroidota bacterium]MBK6890686.1 NifU family protein [Sphingobacteriales bacterium]MBK7526261.1 NifU family protein [Sphingobacteriales bacterium]